MPRKSALYTPRALGLCAGAAAALTLLAAAPASAGIRWKSGDEGVTTMTRAQMAQTLAGVSGIDAAAHHVVVQFTRPITNDLKARLADAGMTLQGYLPDNAFFARIAPGAQAERILAENTLDSIRPLQHQWKMHEYLADGMQAAWAIVGDANAGKEGLATDPIIAVYVQFHDDVDLETAGRATLDAMGVKVVSSVSSTNSLVIEIPHSLVNTLADDDRVRFVEPALPPMDVVRNPSNRLRTQAGALQAAPYNLNGAGVKVMVYDAGTGRSTHVDFQGRLTRVDGSGIVSHSTHCAGTIGGGGVAVANNKGMAPGVTIHAYGFASGGGAGFLYTDPGDINTDYGNAINIQHDAISSNSIGNNVAGNGHLCSWEGDYANTEAAIDNIVRGGLGAPIIVHWAAGNERGVSPGCFNQPGGITAAGYHSVGPPSCNKNAIVVGALNSNDDSVTSFTSWGPTDDGRLKPDISAPGCQSGADASGGNDGGVTSCTSTSDTSYGVMCGTSMATPTVAGCSALLLQDYRANHVGAADPLPSTFKVMYVQTAQDIQNIGPDYKTGYGSIRVQNAVDFERTNTYLENVAAGTNDDHTITVNVPAGSPTFKATLSWDDVPGAFNVATELVNDLDLVVTDPNGVRRFPWTLDPANPSLNAVQTAEDHKNNLEQVAVSGPAAGVWTILVRATGVSSGPQKYSLAYSAPRVVACPGDTNGDGIVNFADLNTVLAQFGQIGAGLSGDVNGDGVVNFGDLNIVLANFGIIC